MSADRVPIEQIIVAWKATWGNQFPKNREEKLMQFSSFFETAKEYGYTHSTDFPNSILNKVLHATVNENHRNKANLKIWKQIHTELLEQAYVVFFDIVTVKQGVYKEKHKISSGGVQYEPATEVVEAERPALDLNKLGPAPEMATETLSDNDFLDQLERGDDE